MKRNDFYLQFKVVSCKMAHAVGQIRECLDGCMCCFSAKNMEETSDEIVFIRRKTKILRDV